MQISTAQMFARGVEQMSEQKSKVTEMQAKLSTGKQILNPSDDAEKAGTIQRIKTAAGRQDSYEKTLNTMNDRLATEDAALRSIDNVMQRVRVLAVQASSDATSAADKKKYWRLR
jgi:flagellar hook-associated protein 3 FlgL